MKKNVLYHIALWAGLYIVWLFVFQNHAFTVTRTMTVEFCYLVFIALDFYCIIYLVIPGLLQKKNYLLFFLASTAIIIFSAVARAGVASFMNEHFYLAGKEKPAFSTILLNSFINIFIWVQCITAAKLIWDKVKSRQYLSVIEKENTQNELNFLKAQINPHFLFNSLNSIYGHIDKNNKTARNILVKFSEMLRYQLYECNADKVSMANEIKYIRNYVTLQQYRKEEDLVVEMDIDDSLDELEIAPLLLVVFIENAFKYVSSFENKENKIIISIGRKQDLLQFYSCNTVEKEKQSFGSRGGIGINNVKRRLELLYSGKHALQVNSSENLYEVNLEIQLS